MINHSSHRFININYLPFSIIVSFFICLISSYFICLILNNNVFFHTDSFAPIQQIISLVNFESVDLTDLHLARIPSLLPDLAIIYIIIKLLGQQDVFVIQSIYAFISTFLYLFGSISVVSLLYKFRCDSIILSFIFTFINLVLIKFSSFYREIFGHFLTPVHQGGNIIMTIFFVILILIDKNNIQPFTTSKKLLYLLITVLAAVSFVSNKLFLFTAIIPLLIIFIIYRLVLLNKSKFNIYLLSNYLILFTLGLFIFLFSTGFFGIKFGPPFSISWYFSKLFQVVGVFIISFSNLNLFVSNYNCIYNFNVLTFSNISKFYTLQIREFLLNFKNNSINRYFIIVLLPVFFSICLMSLRLNIQCMYNISIDISSRLKELSLIVSNSNIIIPIFITFLIILYFSIKKVFNILHSIVVNTSNKYSIYTNTNNILDVNSFYNSSLTNNFIYLFISLSGLSPFLYIWPAEGVYIRYMLISILLFPLVITILIFNPNNYFYQIINKPKFSSFLKLSTLAGFSLILIIHFFSNNIIKPNYSFTKWPINQIVESDNPSNLLNTFVLSKSFRRSALLSKSDFALDHEQISLLGLKNGLSDYWGSSVSEIGNSKIKVSPILPNGKPNYWAHSPYNYRSSIFSQISNYNFVYSRNIDFTNSIVSAYGRPDRIYQLDKEKLKPKSVRLESLNSQYRYVLIYDENSKGWHNIQDKIFQKKYKEGCQ